MNGTVPRSAPLTPLGISALSLLVEEPMHPYEMYQPLMARHEDRLVKVRPGTLYQAVGRLAERGLVETAGIDREGNRPERTTYRITPAGREALTERLQDMLAQPVNEYPTFPLAVAEAYNLPAAGYAACRTSSAPGNSRGSGPHHNHSRRKPMENVARPWPALWSLVIGFFMILIDTTIVSVANPRIMEGLNADINSVIWVTSAYLLAYAVPLLITGRLGDRFGPKKLYLTGLVVFTLASLWCGLSGDVQTLILARVVQGFGAAIMTPQTMAVITRIFPPDRRGAAMGIWGATAGVATLVGPILGGLLVDGLGWEWIFFINVPVGIAGFILALRFVPSLTTHPHKFDIPGVLLSAVGLFLLVFGIQEGETYNWGTISGPITVWSLIIAGLVVLAGFVIWQRFNPRFYGGEPLVPLQLFGDRNFSLANLGITTVGFTVTAFGLPLIFYYQMVRGLTPTQSALMMIPMALISGGLAPVVGRIIDRVNPKYITAGGLVLMSVALFWNSALMRPDTPIWLFLLPSAVLGFANAGIWAPLSSTATRNLPPRQAGAGAGVYNTTRQIGAVLGSAAIAVLMQARLADELPAAPGGAAGEGSAMSFGGQLPEAMHAGFSTAMSQSIMLPAAVIVLGAAVALFFAKPKPVQNWGGSGTPETESAQTAQAKSG